jgi:hypothetical protein
MKPNQAEQYAQIKKLIGEVGLFCRGTVLKLLLPCGKPGCRCQTTPPKLHGPYYRWTRKVDGKTVTRQVRADQAKLLRQYIANGRRLDAALKKLEQISGSAIDEALRPEKGET